MYNRYIPDHAPYEKVEQEKQKAKSPPPPQPSGGLFSPEGLTGRLGGLLKQLNLKKTDSGDLLILLILLFLFLESDDNLDLVITLALLLLFGLFGKDEGVSEP